MQILTTILAILCVVVLAAMAYVRFTPVSAEAGKGRPSEQAVGSYASEGGHYEVVSAENFDRERLEAAILNHPRSERLADGVYATRTAIWAFPDIIHVWEGTDTLHIAAHLVYGRKDLGMNRARVESWLEAARR
ncbi:MAG: hypothetical protein AAGH70_01285 [Pseudomonadota bacterium]